jgi:putative intracellular protease/amidase
MSSGEPIWPVDDGFQELFDALVIPGGVKGAETLSQKSSVQALVQDFYKSKKVVAMICAGTPRSTSLLQDRSTLHGCTQAPSPLLHPTSPLSP